MMYCKGISLERLKKSTKYSCRNTLGESGQRFELGSPDYQLKSCL